MHLWTTGFRKKVPHQAPEIVVNNAEETKGNDSLTTETHFQPAEEEEPSMISSPDDGQPCVQNRFSVSMKSTGSSRSGSSQETSGRSYSTDRLPSLDAELQHGPFQPKDSSGLNLQVHISKGKTRHFQSSWFERFPWLHISLTVKSVLCYPCARANCLSLLSLNTKMEQTFVSTGFSNWKKVCQRLLFFTRSASVQLLLKFLV